MAMSKDKQKALTGLMAGINKQFGAGSINFVKDIKDQLTIKFIKTPSHEFNLMLNGGFGVGKVIELFGENSAGKTSLALETIAYNQKIDKNFVAGWFETENSYDPEYAKLLGIDPERLVYWDQKDCGAEQGFDLLRGLVASGQFNMIVVNSVAGLCPKAEIEGDIGDSQMALTARMMSKLMRVITGVAGKMECTIVFINQLRSNIGNKYVPNVTSGGRALSFYASQRIGMSKYKLTDKDPIPVDSGIKISNTVAKNRLAKGNPYKTCVYYAIWGVGIDSFIELPAMLDRSNILFHKGAWWSWIDEKTGDVKQIKGVLPDGTTVDMPAKWGSKDKLLEFLKINPKFVKQMTDLMDACDIKAESLSSEVVNQIEAEEKELEKEFDDKDDNIEE